MSALAEVAHVLDVSPFTTMHSLRWLGDHLLAGGEEGALEVSLSLSLSLSLSFPLALSL